MIRKGFHFTNEESLSSGAPFASKLTVRLHFQFNCYSTKCNIVLKKLSILNIKAFRNWISLHTCDWVEFD